MVDSIDLNGKVKDVDALKKALMVVSTDSVKDLNNAFRILETESGTSQAKDYLENLRKTLISNMDLSGITKDTLQNTSAWKELSSDVRSKLNTLMLQGYDTEAIAKIVFKGDIDTSTIYSQIADELAIISHRKYVAQIQVLTDFISDSSSITDL
jgi:uncharacterized protein YoxC